MLKLFFTAFSCIVLVSTAQEWRFKAWMSEHGKHYSGSQEYRHRFGVFMENLNWIKAHRRANHTFEVGLNQFSDLTDGEFAEAYLIETPQDCSATHKKGNHISRGTPPPASIDWRDKGAVSGVKNQGHCGSCWTFSTTGCMESHMKIQYNHMFNLSEQQLVDCAGHFNNHGCSGGLPSQAFEYIRYAQGLETEMSYPYLAKNGTKCSYESKKTKAFVRDVVNITQYDEDQLMDAVGNVGPVSIAFQVASDFKHYKSGVYTSTICQSAPEHVNHAVLAVGYGTLNGIKYWTVKNSWGKTWGDKGFFKIERGRNMCGVADCASYPIVSNHPTIVKAPKMTKT